MKVAIVIPTINRPDFIIRQARFYHKLNSEHPLYIGDSSDEETFLNTKRVFDNELSQLKINYYHVPNLNDGQTVHFLLSQVEEKYVVFIGDDDFQIPSMLNKCAEFLENNPSYNIVSGSGLLFSLNSKSGLFGEIDSITQYRVPNILGESASERLKQLFQKYSPTHFGVHNTKNFLNAYNTLLNIPDKRFRELLPAAIDVIQGKNKVFQETQFLRQHHNHRYLLPNWFDWISNKDWFPSLTLLKSEIAMSLVSVEQLKPEKASKNAQDALEIYFNQTVLNRELLLNKSKFTNVLRSLIPQYLLTSIRRKKLEREKQKVLKINANNKQLAELFSFLAKTR